MPAIGITGGISTGKCTFVECLRELLPIVRFSMQTRQHIALGSAGSEKSKFGANLARKCFQAQAT